MQAAVIFGITTAVVYFLVNLLMNRFNSDPDSCKSLKKLGRECCLIFLSVLLTNFVVDTMGLATFTIKQKGGSNTAAFVSKPDF